MLSHRFFDRTVQQRRDDEAPDIALPPTELRSLVLCSRPTTLILLRYPQHDLLPSLSPAPCTIHDSTLTSSNLVEEDIGAGCPGQECQTPLSAWRPESGASAAPRNRRASRPPAVVL